MSTSPGSGDDENFMVIPIDQTFSDGDQNTWPKGPGFGLPDDHTYREKLASLWLQKTGAAEPGTYTSCFIWMIQTTLFDSIIFAGFYCIVDCMLDPS